MKHGLTFVGVVLVLALCLTSCKGNLKSESNGVVNEPKKEVKVPTEYCEELVKLAEEGNAEAQARLAMFYYDGTRGVNRDAAMALKWAQLADEQGHPGAAQILAFIYVEGFGVPRDVDKGLQFLEKSADRGSGVAAANLGTVLFYGETEAGIKVQQDLPKAIKYLKIGAEKGEPQAQETLAVLYCQGVVVDGVTLLPSNPRKCFELYMQVADNKVGYPTEVAEFGVGTCYMQGIGTDVDYEKGLYWIKKAAAHGSSLAIDFLQKYSNMK